MSVLHYRLSHGEEFRFQPHQAICRCHQRKAARPQQELSFFERTKSGQSVDAVDVDCGRLDYISSAGLRVLLIMHKACKGGVSLHGENEVVSEILCQTGFDSIFH